MITAETITAAIDAIDWDTAGTRKGSHTMQTRRTAAALRALGLKRGQYSARVTREPDGTYGHAFGNVRRSEHCRLIFEHREALAAAGFLVWVLREDSCWISTGSHPGVRDLRDAVAEATA